MKKKKDFRMGGKNQRVPGVDGVEKDKFQAPGGRKKINRERSQWGRKKAPDHP